MSNSTNNPAAGPQYQPETLNPGQDAAGAVSQSGTATATRPAGPQQPRRATIRRATLPGQDATAADSGPIPATAPDLPEIVAALQKTAAAFAVPDIVAAFQKTAAAFAVPGIVAALQKVTRPQEAAILQVKTAAAFCISINATPAGISRQIDYFARLELGFIGKATPGREFVRIISTAREILDYYENNPIAAENEKLRGKNAELRDKLDASTAENEKLKAQLSVLIGCKYLVEHNGNSVNVRQQTAAGPQPGHPAKQPGNPQQPRRADFMPSIFESEIILIYDNLPGSFQPSKAQFAALFGKPIKMPAPIETTPARAAALLEALFKADFIKAAQYAVIAERRKCFKYKGKIITATQLRRAKDTNKASNQTHEFDYIAGLSEKAQI